MGRLCHGLDLGHLGAELSVGRSASGCVTRTERAGTRRGFTLRTSNTTWIRVAATAPSWTRRTPDRVIGCSYAGRRAGGLSSASMRSRALERVDRREIGGARSGSLSSGVRRVTGVGGVVEHVAAAGVLLRERQSAGAVKRPRNRAAVRSDRIAVLTGCGLRIGRDWQARSPPATTMRRSPPPLRGFRALRVSCGRREELVLTPSAGLRAPHRSPGRTTALSASTRGRGRNDRDPDRPAPNRARRDMEHQARRHRTPRPQSRARLTPFPYPRVVGPGRGWQICLSRCESRSPWRLPGNAPTSIRRCSLPGSRLAQATHRRQRRRRRGSGAG